MSANQLTEGPSVEHEFEREAMLVANTTAESIHQLLRTTKHLTPGITRRAFLSRSGFFGAPLEAGTRKWPIAEPDKYTSIIVRKRDRRCVTCAGRRHR